MNTITVADGHDLAPGDVVTITDGRTRWQRAWLWIGYFIRAARAWNPCNGEPAPCPPIAVGVFVVATASRTTFAVARSPNVVT